MKKFIVEIYRDYKLYRQMEVFADSDSTAKRKAIEMNGGNIVGQYAEVIDD